MFLQRRRYLQFLAARRSSKEMPLHFSALCPLNLTGDVLVGQLVDYDVKLFTILGIAQQASLYTLFVRVVKSSQQVLFQFSFVSVVNDGAAPHRTHPIAYDLICAFRFLPCP